MGKVRSFPTAPELLGMEAQDEPGGDIGDIHSGALPQHGADPSAASAAAAAGGFGSEPKGKTQSQALAPPKIWRRDAPALLGFPALCPAGFGCFCHQST